jgi:hypothetical protein
MALFMDMHTLDGPVGLDDVAQAHAADLQTQDAHGVHYLRYWVDQDRGKIFVSLRKSCDGGCGVLRGRRLRHAGRGA